MSRTLSRRPQSRSSVPRFRVQVQAGGALRRELPAQQNRGAGVALACQANTGLSPRGKKSHQLSLGQWQRLGLGAGRGLQSNHLFPPYIYRLQFKSFWHYLFGGLRRKRERKGSQHSPPCWNPQVPEGGLPELAAALTPSPRLAPERAQGAEHRAGGHPSALDSP